MSKSILILLTTLCISSIPGVSHATPTPIQKSSTAQKDIHNSTTYWMHLWEERLRDEYSHVQNKMSTIDEYNQIKKQLFSTFKEQYGHELKYVVYEKIRILKQEGILSHQDEQAYASFIINTEIKLHDNG